MDLSWQPSSGAAQRRRGRRLRAACRHEQQSIAQALAAFTPPLSPPGTEEGQGRGGGERGAPHGRGPEDSSSPAGALQPVRGRARRGRRPASLAEPPGPQERIQGRTVEQLACRNCSHGADPRRSRAADSGPAVGSAQALRQHGARAGDRRAQDHSSTDVIPQRAVLRVLQMAEQLVDEPVPSFDDFELVQVGEEEEDEHPQVVPGLASVLLMDFRGAGLLVRRRSTGG